MNYPAAELRSIKMDFCPINPDAEHRGILLIKCKQFRNGTTQQPKENRFQNHFEEVSQHAHFSECINSNRY